MRKWARLLFTPNLPLGGDGHRVTASKEHIALSRRAASEGMVLLKNEREVLPLAKGSRVALFGKGTFDYVKGGGGSGDVTVPYIRTIYDGFKEQDASVFEESAEFYREYVSKEYKAGIVPGMVKEPVLPADILKRAALFTDTAIVSISRFSGEGWDRKAEGVTRKVKCEVEELVEASEKLFDKGDFYLTSAEKKMVSAVKKSFDKVVVVLNVGGMVDTSWFIDDDEIDSVLMAWQGGMEGACAAADAIMGKTNPSGKLPDTFASSLEDYPSTAGFHESDDYVDYTEDIYVGYRYFETIPGASEKVNYPFGYGLSYTDFLLDEPEAARVDQYTICASVRVTNVGDVAGKEVVQVYYSAPQGKLGKPAKELAAFQKTRLLQPGESQLITVMFDVASMASYDDLGKIAKAAYVLEKGDYHFFIGTSIRDCEELNYTLTLSKDKVTQQLSNKLVPKQLSKRMLSDGSFEKLPTSKPEKVTTIIKRKEGWEAENALTPAVAPADRIRLWGPEGSRPHLFIEVVEGKITLDEFMEQMTDDELFNILGGQPNTGVANTFGYGNIPRLEVPNLCTADGPAGVRIRPDVGVETTAFPCATLLASTWNPQLVEEVGKAGGEELKENNLGAWLTPALNIHRSPLCGRNFEYYSEDPLIAGKMGAAMVRGIQSNRVAATPKHFAFNNKESNRKKCDARVSERAAREIYLKGFEIIVKESDPWTIMSSYNLVNGERCSQSRELLTDILRYEWGFDGMVMTDWWGFGEHYKEVAAGNDVKMGCGYPEELKQAVDESVLNMDDVRISAKRVLELILKLD